MLSDTKSEQKLGVNIVYQSTLKYERKNEVSKSKWGV